MVRIPPAAYGSPAIRAANSAARSPAKTRWAWQSTKPGMHGAAAEVDALVGGRGVDRAADPGHPAVVDDQRGVRRRPSEPSPCGRVVGDQLDRCRSAACCSSGSSASDRRVQHRGPRRRAGACPPPDDDPAADDHVVRRPRSRRTRPSRRVAPAPGGAHRVEADGDQVGRGADLDPAGVRQAERRVPAGGRGVEQLGGRPVPALLRGEPLVAARPRAPPRTGRSRRGCPSRASAGSRPRAARRPGRCRRRGRARWWGTSRRRCRCRRAARRPRRSGGSRARRRCAGRATPCVVQQPRSG